MSFHRRAFTVSLTVISRILIAGNRMLGVRLLGHTDPRTLRDSDAVSVSRLSIPSGGRVLDAKYVRPARTPAWETVLICHGIGETVDQWFPVQHLLASDGVASLVVNYSGYGKSTGHIDWTHCEEDAIAAFRALERLAPGEPITLLGFSLGSGVAAAIVNRVPARRLILCAAFTSFRDAARSAGLPAWLSSWGPPIWSAEESLKDSLKDSVRDSTVPVLVVHGERDRLFPVAMARALAAHCGRNTELIVVPGIGHNEPFGRPSLSYWRLLFPK